MSTALSPFAAWHSGSLVACTEPARSRAPLSCSAPWQLSAACRLASGTVPCVSGLPAAPSEVSRTTGSLTHSVQGMAFARNAFGGDSNAGPDYEAIASAVFTSPPLSSVGLSQEKAQEKYGDIDVYTSSFRSARCCPAARPSSCLLLPSSELHSSVIAQQTASPGQTMCDGDMVQHQQQHRPWFGSGPSSAHLRGMSTGLQLT